MGSCTDAVAVAVLGVVASGCVTGHLFDAGRRWERAAVVREAAVDGDRLLLAYIAAVTNDVGAVLGRRERRAAVRLPDVRGSVAMEAVRVDPLPDDQPLGGTPVAVVRAGEASAPAACATAAPALTVSGPPGGGPPKLELAAPGEPSEVAIYANVLTRRSTAPWVYPLVPVALATDAVAVPVLLFFAPAVIVIGD